jgi:3-deoxy-D-manno-octulosonic-acid transferase
MHTSTKIIRSCYSLLFTLAVPFILLRLLIRSRKQPNYRRRWSERFGFIKPTHKPCIWMHTVSVGETIAAIPLIEKLIALFPDNTIYVTTTTPTGSEQVTNHFGNKVAHTYLPYDIPCCLKRFIKRTQPKLSIMMETEVWPNLLYVCKQQQVPTLLANARLSEKSYHGYARLKTAANDLFNLFTHIAAQSELDANHFKQLGVLADKISITGSIKFDRDISVDIKQQAEQYREQWQLNHRPVLIAASTREGEEVYILDAYKKIKQHHPEAFLLLVPRHPERCDQIAKQCESAGFTLQRRSQQTDKIADYDLMLGDTIGEMFLLYALADIAYVGGSLVNTGCHNVLEPAALGMPIITGPYIRNFKVICGMLERAGAQSIVNNADELATVIDTLIADPIKAKTMGQHAALVYQSNKGATQKHLDIISKLIRIC